MEEILKELQEIKEILKSLKPKELPIPLFAEKVGCSSSNINKFVKKGSPQEKLIKLLQSPEVVKAVTLLVDREVQINPENYRSLKRP